jgi:hypothetical protein
MPTSAFSSPNRSRRGSTFRGPGVLRDDQHGEVAFVTLTRFDSLDAIRVFAGDDHDKAVLEPTARALLSRYSSTGHG